jgi:hypothetical protein
MMQQMHHYAHMLMGMLMGCFLGSSGLLAAGLGTVEQWQHRRSSTAVRATESSV